MNQRTPFARNHLKKAIARYEASLRKARHQAKRGDSAAVRRFLRWEKTLAQYKRTLEQIEKIEKRGDPPEGCGDSFDMTDKGALKEPSKVHELIAKFMSASSPMETYLQQGKPLTDHQLELVSLTVSGLQTFLGAWMRRHGVQHQPGSRVRPSR